MSIAHAPMDDTETNTPLVKELLSLRSHKGPWIGSSPGSIVATASSISALVLAEQYGSPEQHGRRSDDLFGTDQIFQCDLSELIVDSLHWLACHQNSDGGWGDTVDSPSSIAATTMVQAAFHLTGVPARYHGMLERADALVRRQTGSGSPSGSGGRSGQPSVGRGGPNAGSPLPVKRRAAHRLRRWFGLGESESPESQLFHAAVLTCAALADLVTWHQVPQLTPEGFLGGSYLRRLGQFRQGRPQNKHNGSALALALSAARFVQSPPWNPVVRRVRRTFVQDCLETIARDQPENGGFFDSVSQTAFIVMAVASTGAYESQIVRRGVELLLASVRSDGSWPEVADVAVRHTSMALASMALASTDNEDSIRLIGQQPPELTPEHDAESLSKVVEAHIVWILNSQRNGDSAAGGNVGGWGWSPRSGAFANTYDTSLALVALAQWQDKLGNSLGSRIHSAASGGVQWLVDAQREDGGWATYAERVSCPSHKGCVGFTAHSMRALSQWLGRLPRLAESTQELSLQRQCRLAMRAGLASLSERQHDEGHWESLTCYADEMPPDSQSLKNSLATTSQVLMTLAELGYEHTEMAVRGLNWLVGQQQIGGCWSGGVIEKRGLEESEAREQFRSDVDLTAFATTALLKLFCAESEHSEAIERGIAWLVDAVENDRFARLVAMDVTRTTLWFPYSSFPLCSLLDAWGEASRDDALSSELCDHLAHLSSLLSDS